MNENSFGSFELCTCIGDCNCVAECQYFNEITEEESPLTQTTIGYLLDEVLKKKKQLLDPRHRRNKFFLDIRDRLIEQGFHFNAKTLEKKFHNLKKHFVTLCQNRDRAAVPSKKPITWPYFHKMMEIYAEELEIKDAPTMASLYPDIPLPKNARHKDDKINEEECKFDLGLNTLIEAVELDENGETTWTHKVVCAFLQECIKKKDDLWDPNVRRRKIFTEIRYKLKSNGYHFSQESLDRKLRNMKTHYQITTKAIKASDNIRRRRNPWPYYDQLHEIYGEDIELLRKKSGRGAKHRKTKISSELSCTVPKAISLQEVSTQSLPFVQLPQNNHLEPSNIQSEESLQTENLEENSFVTEEYRNMQSCSLSPGELDTQFQEGESTMDYSFNTENDNAFPLEVIPDDTQGNVEEGCNMFIQEILTLEERRTVVAEQLLEELKELNRIREKKLQFNQIKLEHLKARAKRKRNH